ncbi:aspartic protease [Boeremia exigua]|uniref:aspartic protease n=1 Tax=Boeremia exigua TaxID=749465 RepID=UPI001E8CBC96|nr:aspartic protease [Boeremia exigua]KAH6638091.1 aspartic protease [Boeremia exigua]
MAGQLHFLLVVAFLSTQCTAAPASTPVAGPGYVTGSVQHFIGRSGSALIPTMQLGFGNPPQKVTVLLDTGSSDLVVPQTGSAICNDPQQQCTANRDAIVTGSFNVNNSTGVTKLRTTVNATFVNGVALQGNLIKTALTVQNQTVNQLQMALVTQGQLPPDEPLFPIFGVGPIQGEAAQDLYQNIPAGMKDAGATNSNAFGLYLNDFRGPDGSIAFGGVDTAKFQGDLKAAPLVRDNDGLLPSFVVDFSSMMLLSGNSTAQKLQQRQTQDSSVDLAPRDGLGVALIDSGAPSLAIPASSMRALARALGTAFNEDDGSLGNLPCGLAQQDMSLGFGFNNDNAQIQVPLELMLLPNQTTVVGEARSGADCMLPIFATDDLNTLGAPFVQAAYVVFDMDAQQLLMAQAVINATESNVQEYTAYMSRSIK